MNKQNSNLYIIWKIFLLGMRLAWKALGKAVFFYFPLQREECLEAVMTGLKMSPSQWVSIKRPFLDPCSLGRGRLPTGTSQGSPDEISLNPNHARWQLVGRKKNSPKSGLVVQPPKYFTGCQKVICEELGKEVHLKTSLELVYNILRCLILLRTVDSFWPLKSMWELPAKRREEAGPESLTKELLRAG